VLIVSELATRDRVLDERTRGLTVSVEFARFERIIARLLRHSLTATSHGSDEQ
jgi:hypothetical protein